MIFCFVLLNEDEKEIKGLTGILLVLGLSGSVYVRLEMLLRGFLRLFGWTRYMSIDYWHIEFHDAVK